MRNIITIILLWAGISCHAYATQASVAMITGLTGNTLSAGKSVALFSEFQTDSTLELTDHSKVTLVLFNTGKEYILDGPVKAKINTTGINVNGKLLPGKTLLVSTDGLNLSPKDLEQAAVIMRGGLENTKQAVNILYPRGSKLLEPQPIFKWESPGQGYKFRFEILNPQGESLFVTETDQTEIKLPEKLKLPTELLLTWEVEASKGSEVLFNSADFMLAAPELVERITRQKPANNASFSHIALYIKILENFSFKHEAQKYKALLKR